ncbi:hypothetical protein PH5382_02277 [Phaeobacter sp. CECT 5382]|uniref:hypothetical protein n=1 Tax=Phaeobacter sp. CECT 5382 TaxID=1712645 RepID=UPI0006DB0491|nr:hypothetical protein [Phaeobacter sp. CECT 5382]CUH88342.1 hypothetical protein PH5382_02277 [Phaeobacter sp. CECT 5382]
MRHLIFCSLAFLSMLLAPVLVLFGSNSLRAGEPVLVVTLPWGPSAASIVSSAGLFEISPETAPFGALTVLTNPADAKRLRENGAWFVLDGKTVAQLCAQ